jgi:hypothetical protein
MLFLFYLQYGRNFRIQYWTSLVVSSGVFGGSNMITLGDSILVTFGYINETIYYKLKILILILSL